MKKSKPIYPDLSEIWRQKKERRLHLSRLPIEKKLELLRKWQEGMKVIKAAKLIDKA